MYAKLISGTLKRAPNKVDYNNTTIFNPSEDVLLKLGYLPVTYTDAPTDPPSGQHYEPHWEQGETGIKQVWILMDDPEELKTETTMSDLEAAVERGLTS